MPDPVPPTAPRRDARWLALAVPAALACVALASEPRVNARVLRAVVNPHEPLSCIHEVGALFYILAIPITMCIDAGRYCGAFFERMWHSSGLLYAPLLLLQSVRALSVPFTPKAVMRYLFFLDPRRRERSADPDAVEPEADPETLPRWRRWLRTLTPPPKRQSRRQIEEGLDAVRAMFALSSGSALVSHLLPLLPQRVLFWTNPVDVEKVEDWRAVREPPQYFFLSPREAAAWEDEDWGINLVTRILFPWWPLTAPKCK
jgi:hypothetical protein